MLWSENYVSSHKIIIQAYKNTLCDKAFKRKDASFIVRYIHSVTLIRIIATLDFMISNKRESDGRETYDRAGSTTGK